jgi:hypothetical protein
VGNREPAGAISRDMMTKLSRRAELLPDLEHRWLRGHQLRAWFRHGDTSTSLSAHLFPLSSVRLLDSPFSVAVAANRDYLLALDPDRLLAPFQRESGLEPRKPAYGNWESGSLDGHTAGHYLSALATMIASGADTPEDDTKRRLDYVVGEMDQCQKFSGDGYLGGVPGSRDLWKAVAAGRVEAVNGKWVRRLRSRTTVSRCGRRLLSPTSRKHV